MTAPTLADARRALAYADENMRLAEQAADDAERHGRLMQAAAAYSSAGRVIDGLARAIDPAPPRWGVALSLPGRGSSALFSPGPR